MSCDSDFFVLSVSLDQNIKKKNPDDKYLKKKCRQIKKKN